MRKSEQDEKRIAREC